MLRFAGFHRRRTMARRTIQARAAVAVNVHGHLHGTAARPSQPLEAPPELKCELTAYRRVRLLELELAATARAPRAGEVKPQEKIAPRVAIFSTAAPASRVTV